MKGIEFLIRWCFKFYKLIKIRYLGPKIVQCNKKLKISPETGQAFQEDGQGYEGTIRSGKCSGPDRRKEKNSPN
jgi:hypothetical protein